MESRITDRSRRLASRWALVAALAGLFWGGTRPAPGTEASETPLWMPGCTVVLFSGLPGDIESENSYLEQMQSWIELVIRNGQVRNLFVLSSQPELLKLPVKPASEVLKGDRAQFLALGRTLAKQKSPLVVIAWGHGGNQRSTPVFHVRGPRITPDDFAAFAEQAGAAESRWALLFCGSGAFARKLAGPQRAIISSECETAFTSDPIGMPLLVKSAAEPGVRSFEQLGTEFGRAVASWYEERHLARTEEPTFWKPGDRPRLLATLGESEPSGGAEMSRPARNQPARLETPPGAEKPNDSSENVTPPADRELAAAWKDIKKVAPERYPEAEAVVLWQSLRCTLGSSPAVVTEQEKFIQVLTPEGRTLGDFDVSFAPPQEELEFLDCEVLSPGGKMARLNPDAIREGREQELGEYQAQRRKFFSLPGVVPGAVLRVHFRAQWKEFPLPKISTTLPLVDELPVLKASIQISVANDSSFHFAFENISAPDPEIKKTTYSTSYGWVLDNIPAHRDEVLSAPGQNPRLLISTFTDWKAFAEWYGRISRLTDEVTPEIAAKAKELTTGAATDRDKVSALYNFVTTLRYVAVPLGVNSVRPHSAANVLQNQFGDCKDKANLLNALLHALDIDAHLVLVPRFSQAHEAVPGLAFNHAISRVTLGGETLWLDTTDDVCRFGMLPPGDPGRKVLPIDGHTTALVQMPVPSPQDHRLTISGRIGWPEKQEGFPAELTVTAKGYPDYGLRTIVRQAKDRHASAPLLAARYRPVAGSFALRTQTATAASALGDDYVWQAQGACIGLAAGPGNTTRLRSPFWIPREWDLALHQRQSALFLNQGYPLTLEEEFDFKLPPGAKPGVLPPPIGNDRPPLRWRVEWASLGHEKISARFSAQMPSGELTEAATVLAQEQLRTLLMALASEAGVTLSE